MTSPAPKPVQVEIGNWPKPECMVTNSTFKTYLIDSAGTAGPTYVQVASYEPNRTRLSIQALDQDVIIQSEPPTKPDTSSITSAPAGYHLPNTVTRALEIYGVDPVYVNTIAGSAATRVSVMREFRGCPR